MTQRYLTKSRFKIARECPNKLYYTGKKEFENKKNEDSFLKALAEGGMQVGELAKFYFPNGHDITTLNIDEALAQTAELMQQDNVVIYEAAIAYQNLLIRVDILEKKDNAIYLYEVKAKSFDPSEDKFIGTKGGIDSSWKPYIEDIAFQKYVTKQAIPTAEVYAHLMLADKTAVATTDGLNQKFEISRNGNRIVVTPKNIAKEDLQTEILCKVAVDKECETAYQEIEAKTGMSFADYVHFLADHYQNDAEIPTPISRACGDCEFDSEIIAKSGKKRCWQRELKWTEQDFREATIFDVWNLHFTRKDNLIVEKRLKITQLDEEDIGPKPSKDGKLSQSERQWLQVEKYQNKDNSVWLDKNGLRAEIANWTFPLHFIDFETSRVAIPFNKGHKSYEGIAFQFSHHKIYQDGRIEHAGEFLSVEPNTFPNFNFVRELKKQLEQDNGTIFRYATHENSFLNEIYQQLQAETDIADKDELIAFIKSISHSGDKVAKADKWIGERDMVDLCDLVKKYYYDPYTHGSNSIKYVLPGILKQSTALQEKYSQPIYGSSEQLSSLNFKNWQWLKQIDGEWQNPYKQLPKLFDDLDEADKAYVTHLTEIADGGAALTAYARLQCSDISTAERKSIEQGLLKYCELDTLAMVMLYEGWLDLLKD